MKLFPGEKLITTQVRTAEGINHDNQEQGQGDPEFEFVFSLDIWVKIFTYTYLFRKSRALSLDDNYTGGVLAIRGRIYSPNSRILTCFSTERRLRYTDARAR